MKVSKNVSIDLQPLNRVLKATRNFNEAVEEGLSYGIHRRKRRFDGL